MGAELRSGCRQVARRGNFYDYGIDKTASFLFNYSMCWAHAPLFIEDFLVPVGVLTMLGPRSLRGSSWRPSGASAPVSISFCRTHTLFGSATPMPSKHLVNTSPPVPTP